MTTADSQGSEIRLCSTSKPRVWYPQLLKLQQYILNPDKALIRRGNPVTAISQLLPSGLLRSHKPFKKKLESRGRG
jgi:hypothetical protein